MNQPISQVSACLRVRDANAAIDFYRAAFGAEEVFRLTEPGGRIGHAELRLGPAVIMLSDEYPEYGIQGPQAYGGTGSSVYLQVADVDTLTQQASQAGATVLMGPRDEFYGERASKLRDPFGHEWMLSQRIEDVSHEEMQRRFEAMLAQ